MSNMFKTEVVQVATEHPLEDIFGITTGTTMVNRVEVAEDEEEAPAPVITYDEKDTEIDNQFQQVFNAAIMTFEAQRMSTEGMNPQFQARALEVAQQFLNTALAAASEKAKLKASKDKNKPATSSTSSGNTTNNTIIMGRNEMLAQLLQAASNPNNIIDSE